MGKIGNGFIHCKGLSEIGSFEFHYGNGKDENSPFKLAFKTISEDTEDGYLDKFIPGAFDINDKFYEFPMKVFYVQINGIQQGKRFVDKDSVEYYFLKIQLTIFNKQYEKIKHIIFEKEQKWNFNLNFTELKPIVNFLNRYIHKINEIENINIIEIEKNTPNFSEKGQIISSITSLKMEFYSDCERRVGKDNNFWDEAVITNLPKNRYFLKIFKSFFKSNFLSYGENQDSVVVTLERDSGWAAYTRRAKFESPTIESDIRNGLLFYAGQHFSIEDYTFDLYTL